jgi:signal transduction histidine kinase
MPLNNKDVRITLIVNQLTNFLKTDYSGQVPVSKKKDGIDKIIIGVNKLGKALALKTVSEQQNKKCINEIIEVLPKIMVADFSQKPTLTEKNNETNAIAVGLNTVEEEMENLNHRLKDSEEKIKIVLEAAQIATWEWDIIHDTTWRSKIHDQIFGYDQNLPVWSHKIFMEHVIPEDRKQVQKQYNEALISGNLNFECRIKKKDDHTIHWIFTQGLGYKNEKGKTIRIFGITLDITKLKGSESETKLQSQKLTLINQELKQLVHVASHDLQEPLRTLVTFSELIKEEYWHKLDNQGKQYIDFISKSAIRMQGLVKDLMDYLIIGNEKTLSLVDCNKIMHEVLDDMQVLVKETKATIIFDHLPHLKAYAKELRLLFQNLINNALKFRKKDVAPIVKITAKKERDAWLFSIEDNGIGIEEKDINKLFIIFKRLHNRSEYEGTGIGLAHCKKIVELHNGSIWVSSTIGVGSTFYFRIPKQINA